MEMDRENSRSDVRADGTSQTSLKKLRQQERNEELKRELDKVINEISDERIAGLVSLINAANLKRIFGDREVMRTALSFINNSLSISVAARALFMHRNTMMYRLNKIKRLTGLDIKRFDDALAFKILYKAFRRNDEEE